MAFRSTVQLLQADEELADGIPAHELPLARRLLVSERLDLDLGPWFPADLVRPGRETFAFLILAGAVARELHLLDRGTLQLLGPGDLLRPGQGPRGLPATMSWTALRPSSLAVLDRRFALAARRWPSLAARIQGRLLDQMDRLSLDAAVAHLPKTEQRVLAVLWHLADRWGRVTPRGVLVPLPLTHDVLGRLAAAQRPTVTLALAQLALDGMLSRVPREGWLLSPASRDVLETVDPAVGRLGELPRVAANAA
jgi:CRP-like cAMP-binding protein